MPNTNSAPWPFRCGARGEPWGVASSYVAKEIVWCLYRTGCGRAYWAFNAPRLLAATANFGSVQLPHTKGKVQSAIFLALSGMKGLQAWARMGPSVFHTILNWP